MSNARATEAWRKYAKPGGLLDYGPDLSRLLVRLMRELAQGRVFNHGHLRESRA
jgi:hypothetical protein